MSKSKTTLVFVYGSLMRGLFNSGLLDGSKLLGLHETDPKYKMYNLGMFPGVCKGGDTPIKGEVYEVTNDVRDDLDCLEGHPDFYKRTKCVQTAWGKASMYILASDMSVDCERVPTGNWHDVRATF